MKEKIIIREKLDDQPDLDNKNQIWKQKTKKIKINLEEIRKINNEMKKTIKEQDIRKFK